MTTNEEVDNIKGLVSSIIICLANSECGFKSLWKNIDDIDQKELLEELEDTVYSWLSDEGVSNWIIEERLWSP